MIEKEKVYVPSSLHQQHERGCPQEREETAENTYFRVRLKEDTRTWSRERRVCPGKKKKSLDTWERGSENRTRYPKSRGTLERKIPKRLQGGVGKTNVRQGKKEGGKGDHK